MKKFIFILYILISVLLTIFPDSIDTGYILSITENNTLNDYVISNYFGIKPGTGIGSAEELIKSKKLDYVRKDDVIFVYGQLAGDIDIKSVLLKFKKDLLIDISIYIDRPVTYIDYFYDILKNNVLLEQKEKEADRVLWSDNIISFEISYSGENKNAKKMVCFHYFINEFADKKVVDYKAFSFSIGGNIHQYAGFTTGLYLIPLMSFGIGVPVTITKYTNRSFGIGFTYVPELHLSLNLQRFGFSHLEFGQRFLVSNKIGRIHNIYFLIEYGAILLLKFRIIDNLWMNNACYVSGGHTVFIGFEKRSINQFLFAFGGTLNFIFGLYTDICLGLEVRFRFDHFEYLKK